MIEKPKEGQEFSNLSILGRVLLTPEIFDIIDNLEPGAGGEYQLTDAMAILAREKGVYALDFEGQRYDLGSKVGFLKANVVKGLSHPETKDAFREFLKEISKDL
jgi:UTP--glucose-1-phosphate uridylyltransferase